MRNLIVIFGLLLTSFVSFGQTLNDIVNFDSLNVNLINTEVFKRINEKREYLKSDLYIKDTIPTYAAKYHLTYFKQHGELVDLHSFDNDVYTDLYNRGYKVGSVFVSPNERLWMAEQYVNYWGNDGSLLTMYDNEYNLIKEISKSYNFGIKKVKYQEIVDLIISDIYQNERQLFFPNLNNIYFGLWNEFIKNNDNGDITFAVCFVLSEKTSN